MAEVKVRYNNSDIAAILKPGGMTLLTAGKYMENNVEVLYTDPNPNVIQDQDDYIVLSDLAGGGGEWTSDGIAQGLLPNGAIILGSTTTNIANDAFREKPITSLYAPNTTHIGNNAFYNCTSLVSLNLPALTSGVGAYSFYGCNKLESTGLPYNFGNAGLDTWNGCSKLKYFIHNTSGIYTRTLRGCSSLLAIDVGTQFSATRATMCENCTSLKTFVIRNIDTVVSLANINAFNNTPFASGKTGGVLYVPNDLIASYLSATNWSTILGYETNLIKSIESTHTDPNAEIDLTLYYADGTPIPTT